MSVKVQSIQSNYLNLILNDTKPTYKDVKSPVRGTTMLYLSIRPVPPKKGGPSKGGDDDSGNQPRGS